MNPHVVSFLLLEAKSLLAVELSGLWDVLLPSMHRREGENRTDTAALMTALAHGGEAVGLGEKQLRAVGRGKGEVAKVKENGDLNRKLGLVRWLSK